MHKDLLTFFPYPYSIDGKKDDGLYLRWPERCHSCTKNVCENKRSDKLQLCPHGLHYVWFQDRILIGGIILSDWQAPSQAYKKARKKFQRNKVNMDDLNKVMKTLNTFNSNYEASVRAEKDAILQRYRNDDIYKKEFLDWIRPQLVQGLFSVHDMRQIIGQITQNMNVILETRYPRLALDDQLRRALHAETSIYWASKLLHEKLALNRFLLLPETITDPQRYTTFRLHGLVLKYVRIYEMTFKEANIKVLVKGASHGSIHGPPDAVGTIPHTLIDNACKYSPKDGTIEVLFEEAPDTIQLSVSSLGPLVEPDERSAIFEPGKRGTEAARHQEEGMGMGLYLAKYIAKQIGTDIHFEQSDSKVGERWYQTVFSVSFRRADRAQG